jgi:hypothetical protein
VQRKGGKKHTPNCPVRIWFQALEKLAKNRLRQFLVATETTCCAIKGNKRLKTKKSFVF